jgi:hypothetical protein
MLAVGDTLCQLLSTWKTPFLVLGCELRPHFTAMDPNDKVACRRPNIFCSQLLFFIQCMYREKGSGFGVYAFS